MTPNEKPASPTQGELAVKALVEALHSSVCLLETMAETAKERGDIAEWSMMSVTAEQGHAALDRTTLPPTEEGWQPTHKHVKRGGTYRLDGYGEIQTDTPLADYAKVAIYRAEDGTTWVRPVSEFEDGRFEAVATPQGTRS